jgi:hypothetical protein
MIVNDDSDTQCMFHPTYAVLKKGWTSVPDITNTDANANALIQWSIEKWSIERTR